MHCSVCSFILPKCRSWILIIVMPFFPAHNMFIRLSKQLGTQYVTMYYTHLTMAMAVTQDLPLFNILLCREQWMSSVDWLKIPWSCVRIWNHGNLCIFWHLAELSCVLRFQFLKSLERKFDGTPINKQAAVTPGHYQAENLSLGASYKLYKQGFSRPSSCILS